MAIRITKRAIPRPRLKPISFFSTGSSGSTSLAEISFLRSTCDMWLYPNGLADERRLEAAEEQPGDQQAHPDHKSEQANEIDRGKLAETLLPEFAEIRQHTDREEGEHEEDHAKHIGLAGSRGKCLGDLRRRAQRKPQRHGEHDDETEDELRESLPDLGRLGPVRPLVDMVGPDIAENESPDADEDVDEQLHRRGGRENPARLILDAFRSRLCHDQRFRDAAAGDRSAAGLDREPYPGSRSQRFLPQERLGEKRQDQDLDDCEYDDKGSTQNG